MIGCVAQRNANPGNAHVSRRKSRTINLPAPYLKRLWLDFDKVPDAAAYPFCLPFLQKGLDLRFMAEDGKTPLAFHIEKFDSMLNEAFVWVNVPGLNPSAQTTIWLYYGSGSSHLISPTAPPIRSACRSCRMTLS